MSKVLRKLDKLYFYIILILFIFYLGLLGCGGLISKNHCTLKTSGQIVGSRFMRSKGSFITRYDVQFEVDGIMYKTEGGATYVSNPPVGEEVKVYYNPSDPLESYAGDIPPEWVDLKSYSIPVFIMFAILVFLVIIKKRRPDSAENIIEEKKEILQENE